MHMFFKIILVCGIGIGKAGRSSCHTSLILHMFKEPRLR